MGTKLSDLPALGATPATDDELPITDVSAADATKKVTVAELRAAVLVPPLPLAVASYADPVIQTAATDLSGAGVALYPFGLGGPVDMAVGPTQPAAGSGKGLTLQAGVGAADEAGGHLTIDAGPPNPPGVAGNVRIGRDNAAEVLIGKEGGGATITLEGTVDVLGAIEATGEIVSAPLAPIHETTTARTLAASDHGRTIFCTHASGCAVTVPDTLPVGFTALLVQYHASGAVTVVGPSVSLQVAAAFEQSPPTTAEQYSAIAVVVIVADEVLVTGDLLPA